MKLETNVREKPIMDIEDAMDQVEEVVRPAMPMARKAEDLTTWTRSCVRNFPLSAVWTAFAGGLLIGAALATGTSRSSRLTPQAMLEPLQKGQRLFFRMWPW